MYIMQSRTRHFWQSHWAETASYNSKGDRKGKTFTKTLVKEEEKRKISYDESKHFVNITVAFSLKNSWGFFCIIFTGTGRSKTDRLLYWFFCLRGPVSGVPGTRTREVRQERWLTVVCRAGQVHTHQPFSMHWVSRETSGSPTNSR